MSPALHFIPITLAAIAWYGIHILNRRKCWFRIGEIIFWDIIVLIVIFLFWLQWF